ncbi:MAG TPA: SURF1 family protein [Usitatibacter sp.]|nr:SURF1 family protein [Usitatibacter sp.]
MRAGPFAFTPGLVPTLAMAALVALTVSLGVWQKHRGDGKERLQALYEARMSQAPLRLAGPVASPDALLFRRVAARGRWLARGQVYIDNQVHAGRAGFAVVTPLELAGGEGAVLVNRGWIERDASYPRAPQVAVPEGTVDVEGLATLPPRFLELSPDVIQGSVFQNLTIDRYRAWSGLAVMPFVVLADAPGPGLAALHERPDAGAAKHREYELTWFLLAATALALWIGLNVRRAA